MQVCDRSQFFAKSEFEVSNECHTLLFICHLTMIQGNYDELIIIYRYFPYHFLAWHSTGNAIYPYIHAMNYR